MRRELKMPFDFAGVGVQPEHRVAVQVRSATCISIIIGPRIPYTPVSKIQVGIIRAGEPNRRASVFPGFAPPGVVTSFTWSWDGIEAPILLASGRLIRG